MLSYFSKKLIPKWPFSYLFHTAKSRGQTICFTNSKKKPRSSELIIGANTVPTVNSWWWASWKFFPFLYWHLEGDHRKQHNFHQIPMPPVSAVKLIWPSCKKEKGVWKGNNNCLSYQCLCHLHAGAAPNNFACFGSRCLLQLLCTGLTAPINSMLFLWLRVAVIWVYECEICLALPPPWVIWVRKCDYIWAEGERCCAKANWTDIVNIYFFLDGRQLYLCAVVKQKRYWFLLQELYTNSKKCTQWELIIETYSSRIFFFFFQQT